MDKLAQLKSQDKYWWKLLLMERRDFNYLSIADDLLDLKFSLWN